MAPRETENNAYAKFWGDKQRALWYVMVFLEWSIKFCCVNLTTKMDLHVTSGLTIEKLKENIAEPLFCLKKYIVRMD